MKNPGYNYYRFPTLIPLTRGLGITEGTILSYLIDRHCKYQRAGRITKSEDIFVQFSVIDSNFYLSQLAFLKILKILEEEELLAITERKVGYVKLSLRWTDINDYLKTFKK